MSFFHDFVSPSGREGKSKNKEVVEKEEVVVVAVALVVLLMSTHLVHHPAPVQSKSDHLLWDMYNE